MNQFLEVQFIAGNNNRCPIQNISKNKYFDKRTGEIKDRKKSDNRSQTTLMIHEFVDKIVVHETDKSTGERIQQIDIYLKYVGKLDVPMPELTPEQIKEEERKRRKHAWNRTYMRRKYEREKAECEAKEKELSEAVG